MLIVKLLLLIVSVFPQDSRWQRITTDQHISFLFPNNVQELKQNTGEIPSRVYQTKDLTCVFGVVCSDFSAMSLDQNNVLLLYEQLKKGSLDIKTAILKDEKTIPYEGMLIKEIEYSIIKDNFEMTYFKRFIFRDNMVYQITIGGRTRHSDILKREREIFFNSITFSA